MRVRVSDSEREWQRERLLEWVREWEKEKRERRRRRKQKSLCVCVCVCVCEWKRERERGERQSIITNLQLFLEKKISAKKKKEKRKYFSDFIISSWSFFHYSPAHFFSYCLIFYFRFLLTTLVKLYGLVHYVGNNAHTSNYMHVCVCVCVCVLLLLTYSLLLHGNTHCFWPILRRIKSRVGSDTRPSPKSSRL